MNATQREALRIALIKNILDAGAMGLRLNIVAALVRAGGFPHVTDQEFANETAYLADKGLIDRAAKTISPENPIWRITADGRDYAASAGIETN